jgi:hypothetical protein
MTAFTSASIFFSKSTRKGEAYKVAVAAKAVEERAYGEIDKWSKTVATFEGGLINRAMSYEGRCSQP